jgi:hypothetical protein
MLEKLRAGLAGAARGLQPRFISQREAELLEYFRRMDARDQNSLLRFGAALSKHGSADPPA